LIAGIKVTFGTPMNRLGIPKLTGSLLLRLGVLLRGKPQALRACVASLPTGSALPPLGGRGIGFADPSFLETCQQLDGGL
jgi:hypothetical protein